jgi:anti-sigma B factor antagonist
MLTYTVQLDHIGIAVIAPPAEIDVTNAEYLQDELNVALDRGITALIVDMSRTSFCDFAGVATICRGYSRASAMHADLRLVVSNQTVLRIFELTGADQVMPIYASLDAAQSGIWS